MVGGPGLPIGDLDGHRQPAASSTPSSSPASSTDVGAPVVSIYARRGVRPPRPVPLGQNIRLKWVARGLFPIWPKGGSHMVDVRDVAQLVVACIEPGRGPLRQYVVPGSHVNGRDTFGAVAAAVGRRRPTSTSPSGWRPVDHAHGAARPRHEQAVALLGGCRGHRDHRLLHPLRRLAGAGRVRPRPRPFDETIRDTVASLSTPSTCPSDCPTARPPHAAADRTPASPRR